MIITKNQLAKSNKKYYKFLFDKKPKAKSYWERIEENSIIFAENSMFEEGIFFAEESSVMKWFDLGNVLTEIIFDADHSLYKKLPEKYSVQSTGFCGQAIITGNFIPMNSERMFQFIIDHYDIKGNNTGMLQKHLIKIRAFDTLERLWSYKSLILGLNVREEKKDAVELLKCYAISDYQNVIIEDVINCNDWDKLKDILTEEQWNFFE